MNWFYNLKISKKLLFSFLAVLSLTMLMGGFSISQIARVNGSASGVLNHTLPSTRYALMMKATLGRMRVSELQHILSDDERDYAYYENSIAARRVEFQRYANLYGEIDMSPEEAAVFEPLKQSFELYSDENLKVLALSRAGKNEEAKAVNRGRSMKLFRNLNDGVDKLVAVNERESRQASVNDLAVYTSSRVWIVGMLITSLVAGTLLSLWISHLIAKPLGLAVEVAKRVAAGDLTAKIEAGYADELGQLMRALETMNISLRGLVGKVRDGTETIATASREIATGNLDLSTRTERQASSLEETAAAMEQLTATVKQNSDNAREASMLAASATEVASQGGLVVSRVVSTMSSINDSSRKIVDIIGVIDSIAFQTNILALNAAVEAARAGEQGRGFGVVASEVRNLAHRSAAAAKQIKELIGNSVSTVNAGNKLVEEAGGTMSDVVRSMRRVNEIVSEINSATNEQSAGIVEINQAIMHMDEETQQNSALVEQAAAAADALAEQGARLVEAISAFTLVKTTPAMASGKTLQIA